MGAAVTDQYTFRFREDDGNETGASWIDAQGVDISRGTGTGNKFRLRILVRETNGGNANVPWPLYASYNGGAYFNVTAASSYVQAVASDYVADDTTTTAQLTFSGTWDDGKFDSDGTMETNVSLMSEYTEMEYCIYLVDADVTNGHTIDFRTYESIGTALDGYTDTPQLTVVKSAGYSLIMGQGSYTLTGQNVGLYANRVLTVGQGSYALSGQTVNLLAGRLLTMGQGSYTLSGQDVGLLAGRLLAMGHGSYTLTGQDVLFDYSGAGADYTLVMGQGSFTLTGQYVGLLAGRKLAMGQGSYTLSGQDVNLLVGRLLAMGQGSYTLSGQDVNLLVGRLLAMGQGSYTLTGQDVGLIFGRRLVMGLGSYALTGQDVGLLVGRLLAMGYGAYVLSGQAVGLTYGGGVAENTPVERTYSIFEEIRVLTVDIENRTLSVPVEDRTLDIPGG